MGSPGFQPWVKKGACLISAGQESTIMVRDYKSRTAATAARNGLCDTDHGGEFKVVRDLEFVEHAVGMQD
ncbi:hypothetical protein [uncultured Algoriphagus sp.]|uniref:hypothetical protein n=1 Tax=uncultured Algoriphagus sp. TaxID=417365 RepID=UPI0030EB48CD|tara:strand:+ start:36230 stop:36439 length:210 start_codon:yes stop_codon:yes gene_type:complete